MALGDLSNYNGLFKTVYADEIKDLIPESALLQKKIPFAPNDKEIGNYYAQPVVLAGEAGFSYLGDSGVVGTLNAALSMTMKEAQVKGSEVVLRSQMAYAALARAAGGSKQAFKKATAALVENMTLATRKRLETSMIYGQKSIGKVSSINSRTITITDATWCPGIWAGSEGAFVQFFDSVSATATEDGAAGVISAVDFVNKTITLGGSTSVSNIDSNSFIWWNGSRTATAHNDMAGLQAIYQNSGTLHNIDASAYQLWAGSNKTSVGQISHAKLQDALSLCTSKGLDGKVLVLVPPKAFAVLNSDMAALRVFDSSYSKKGDNGFESLTFHSTNGQAEIVSHKYVKDGDAFIVPVDSAMRIGSVDLSFAVPGMEDQFFRLVTDKNAVELQCMADQAIFLEKPAHGGYLSGLTYS